jgi:predicted DNA-binding transcriptional regulator AlpA
MTHSNQVTDSIAPKHGKSSLLDSYLRPIDLARELGVSVRTLCRWHALRQGPPRIKVGRQSLFSATSVHQWLASLETTPRRTNVKGSFQP